MDYNWLSSKATGPNRPGCLQRILRRRAARGHAGGGAGGDLLRSSAWPRREKAPLGKNVGEISRERQVFSAAKYEQHDVT